MYRFPGYLTLVSTNHASSNPGQNARNALSEVENLIWCPGASAWVLAHEIVPRSHLEYPICNCVHTYTISPCRKSFLNLSLAASAKQWTSPELKF